MLTTRSNAHKFTGKERDSESNLDYFGARYFTSQMGRFMSADPSGVAFSNPANPQSWNLYSYVQNNPLSAVDPDGRQCVWDDGSYDSADDPQTGSVEGCTNAGGTYFDPSTFHENASLQGPNDDWSASPNSFLAGQVADVQALQDSPPTMPGANQATWGNTFTSGMTTTINFGGLNWFTSQVGTGTHPFRDNNPGDILFGGFTTGQGAIGNDGRFAVFPTTGTGGSALNTLLNSPSYSNLSINDAISRYAPAFENNTAGYQQFLTNVVGVSGNTPLSSLSPSQMSALESGISRYEGFDAAGNSSVTVTSVVNVP